MIVINSAAYVTPELCNEFGCIPPCFLPIGNRKLLTFQVETIKQHFPDEEIIVSLPNQFNLNIEEISLLDKLSIQVVFVPEGLSLGMALLYVLNTLLNTDGVVRLLHGDTLIPILPRQNDVIALSKTQDNYNWEKDENNLVWCGYFSFSSVHRLIRSLAMTQGDFIKAIYVYQENVEVAKENVSIWYDLGHMNTYFHSRTAITTQRAFNSLIIKNGVVWKSSSDSHKIIAEAEWFKNIPVSLKRYTPHLFQLNKENNNYFYEIEYLPNLPLNELFVHGKNPIYFWEKILHLCNIFFQNARESLIIGDDTDLIKQIEVDANSLYETKTLHRLNEYAQHNSVSLNEAVRYDGVNLPSILDIVKECIKKNLELPLVPAIVHGDFCFSNILFDSRLSNIKVIDPRGLNFLKELCIYGDQKYDLAKLAHSVIGLYDLIISDSYKYEYSDEHGHKVIFDSSECIKEVGLLFLNNSFIPKINTRKIIPLTILLFFSMIPLHSDRPLRQKAMLANALRLYKEYIL